MKRGEREREKGERKRKEKKKKTKLSKFFLRCSDGWSSITRELKLIYSTGATSKYQERKDSVLHVPRGRGLSYSGFFSFKGRKWPCGLEPTT